MNGAGRPTVRASVSSSAFWAAAVLPPLAVLILIETLGVNLPFQDDWDTLAVLTKWQAGTLSFQDFWQQHSEHRIVAVKALIWAIGAITRFDVVWEMRVGLLLAAVKLVLLADILRLSLREHAPGLIAPLTLVSSLLMFSLVQQENWFWGLASLQFSLLNLCTVMLMWALQRWPDSWRGLAVAAGCATVALFTEVSGQILWMIGGIAFWLLSRTRDGRLARLLTWIVAGSLIQVTYFWYLRWASSSVAGAFSQPGRLMTYAGAVLGLPVASWMTAEWSAVVGCAGFVALVGAAWFLHRSNGGLLRRLVPLLLFATHGLLVSIVIALGRSGGDPQSALTSHYSFAPTLFWIGVCALVAAAWSTAQHTLGRPSRSTVATILACVTALLAVSYTRGSVEAYRVAYARSRNLRMSLATLYSEADVPHAVLRFLYPPDEERALSLIGVLRKYGLGPFSKRSSREAPRLVEEFAEAPAGDAADGFHDGGDCTGTIGWAWDPAHPDRPVLLEVWVGTTRLGTATANWFRWDLRPTGKGNGQHAFRFVFPAQTELGTGRVVTVTFASTGRPLRGSPKAISCRD